MIYLEQVLIGDIVIDKSKLQKELDNINLNIKKTMWEYFGLVTKDDILRNVFYVHEGSYNVDENNNIITITYDGGYFSDFLIGGDYLDELIEFINNIVSQECEIEINELLVDDLYGEFERIRYYTFGEEEVEKKVVHQ
jgi:hypothetical protein